MLFECRQKTKQKIVIHFVSLKFHLNLEQKNIWLYIGFLCIKLRIERLIMAASFFSARAKEIVSLAEETSKQDSVFHYTIFWFNIAYTYSLWFIGNGFLTRN